MQAEHHRHIAGREVDKRGLELDIIGRESVNRGWQATLGSARTEFDTRARVKSVAEFDNLTGGPEAG